MADSYSWTGGGDGSTWTDPQNWTDYSNPNNKSAPSGSDTALFSMGATLTTGGTAKFVDIEGNVTFSGSSSSFDGGGDDTPLNIGLTGTGVLTLTGNTTVTASGAGWGSVVLAFATGTSATLNMDGGSTLNAQNGLYMASDGTSVINVSGGAKINVTRSDGGVAFGQAIPGYYIYNGYGSYHYGTGTGSVTIGKDSSITVGTGGFEMGGQASQFTVNAGGTFTVNDTTTGIVMAPVANTSDFFTVTGDQATVTDTGVFVVSTGGAGTVNVAQGGSLSIGSDNDLSKQDSLYLAEQAGSTATMTVTDDKSTVTVKGQADIGLAGTATLTLRKGATMTTGDDSGNTAQGIDIGTDAGGTGTLIVQGKNTTLTNTGQIVVAEDGTGTFTMSDGAHVTTSIYESLDTSGFDVATGQGSRGTVTITGTDTALDASDIDLTTLGQATVTVSNGAEVTDSGDFKLEPGEGGQVNFTVTGEHTQLSVTGELSVGGTGRSTATLNLQNQATIDPPDVVIAPNAAPGVQGAPTDPVTGFRMDYVQVINVNGAATLNANDITVGKVGNGALIVAGGTISAEGSLTIGDEAGSQGQLYLDGDDSSLDAGDTTVGNEGKGLLSIGNGNSATTDGDGTVGGEASGSGFVTVGDGLGTSIEGADWSISGDLKVGDSGKGTLTVTPDSTLEVGGDLTIGGEQGSSGHVTFTGGSLSTSGKITVGDKGSGSLLFQTGATMDAGQALAAPSVTLGETLGAAGSMTVTGDGTSVEVYDLTVGESGTGSLKVDQGGTLRVDDTADVGAKVIGAVQKLTLDTGGIMTVGSTLTLGTSAVASVSIKGGAQLAGDADVVLGDQSGGAAGVVTVSGTSDDEDKTPSGLGFNTTLTIGHEGIGKLTISDGALVAPIPNGKGDIEVAAESGSQGTITLSDDGSTLEGASLALGGTAEAAGGIAKLSVGAGAEAMISGDSHFWTHASLSLAGGSFLSDTLDIDKGAAVSGYGALWGTVTDDGSINVSGGLLYIDGDLSGTGSATIASGSSLELGGSAAGVKIQFKGTGDSLQFDTAGAIGATVSGFAAGDTIELAGTTATSASVQGNTLDVFNGTALVASVQLSGDYAGASFDVAANASGSAITLSATQSTPPVVTSDPLTVTEPAAFDVTAGADQTLSGISVADTTAGAVITVELLTTTGLLAATAQGAGSVEIAPDGTAMILSGSVSDVNAELASITYTATESGADTLQVIATDDSNNADAGASAITVPDPAPDLSVPDDQSVVADVPTPIAGISVADSVNQDGPFTVTLTDATGLLSLDQDGSSTVTGSGTASVALTGDLADINADLASLIYTGASTGLDASDSDTIGISIDDGKGGTTNGSIGVTVDQAPDQMPFIKAPASLTVPALETNAISGVSLYVNDSVGKVYTITLSDLQGGLYVSQFGDTGVADTGNFVAIVGSLDDINADLATLTYESGGAAFATPASDTISLTVSDQFGVSADASIDVTIVAPQTTYWALPVDADFTDAEAWSDGAPTSDEAAAFIPGSYFVHGAGSAGKIEVGGTVTFDAAITATGLSGDAEAFVADMGGAAIFGAGSSLTTTGMLVVGQSGQGTVTFEDGATATLSGASPTGAADAIAIGYGYGYPASTLTVDGSTTTLTTDSGVSVEAAGIFAITNGAKVTIGDSLGTAYGDLDLGGATYGAGTLNISGSGSSLDVAAGLVVGNAGSGYLNIGAGSTVESDSATVGVSIGAGHVTIDGAGASWTITHNLSVGATYQSDITVKDGGVLTVQGTSVSLTGSINVTGANSTFDATNAALTTSSGALTVDLGATASLASLALSAGDTASVNANGYYNNTQSLLDVAGAITVDAASLSVYTGGTLDAASISVSGGGTLDDNGGSLNVGAPIDMNDGTFFYYRSATSTNSDPAVVLQGGTDKISAYGFGEPQTLDIAFTDGADATLATTTTAIGTVSGFNLGDTLDLSDVYYDSGDSVTLLAGNVLSIATTYYGTYTIQLDPTQDFSGYNFVLNDDGSNAVDVRLTGTFGTVYTWANPEDGSFGDANAWTPAGGPPGPMQTAIFGPGSYTVNGSGSAGLIDVTGYVKFSGDIRALGEGTGEVALDVDQGGIMDVLSGATLTVGDGSDLASTIIGDTGSSGGGVVAGATLVLNGDFILGNSAGSGGLFTVGGTATYSGTVTIGASGGGTLYVQDGGTFNGSTEVDIAANAGSSGALTLNDGSFSSGTFVIGGTLAGAGGAGTLDMSNQSSLSATDTYVWGSASVADSSFNSETLTIETGGSFDVQQSSIYLYDSLTIDQGGALSGYGSLQEGGTLTDDGVISIDANQTLSLYMPADGTGTIKIGDGGELLLGQFISNSGSGDQAFNVAIDDFAPGQTIALTPYGSTSANSIDGYFLTADGDNTWLTLTDDGTTVGRLTLLGDYMDDTFVISADTSNAGYYDVTEAPCYCPGTMIATDCGARPVESLQIGDLLRTRSGAFRPIKWIGRRAYNGRFILGRKDLLPVCIEAGAIAENVPHRDLWVSPHHAMYLDGVLIEAKDLVNGSTILQAREVEAVAYYHLELETHDIILAEGAWSESFLDDGSRGMFQNEPEYRALYGDEAPAPARYYAPRVDCGVEIEAVRAKLLQRAKPHDLKIAI